MPRRRKKRSLAAREISYIPFATQSPARSTVWSTDVAWANRRIADRLDRAIAAASIGGAGGNAGQSSVSPSNQATAVGGSGVAGGSVSTAGERPVRATERTIAPRGVFTAPTPEWTTYARAFGAGSAGSVGANTAVTGGVGGGGSSGAGGQSGGVGSPAVGGVSSGGGGSAEGVSGGSSGMGVDVAHRNDTTVHGRFPATARQGSGFLVDWNTERPAPSPPRGIRYNGSTINADGTISHNYVNVPSTPPNLDYYQRQVLEDIMACPASARVPVGDNRSYDPVFAGDRSPREGQVIEVPDNARRPVAPTGMRYILEQVYDHSVAWRLARDVPVPSAR